MRLCVLRQHRIPSVVDPSEEFLLVLRGYGIQADVKELVPLDACIYPDDPLDEANKEHLCDCLW